VWERKGGEGIKERYSG